MEKTPKKNSSSAKVEERAKILLAIETSAPVLSVAAVQLTQNKKSAEVTLEAGLVHAEKLQSLCAQVLQILDATLSDVSVLAVALGPGSFTGLRVGVSFMRALAQARGLPLIGVSTLDVLADPLRSFSASVTVVESINDEFFAAFYGAAGAAPAIYTRRELIKKISTHKQIAASGIGLNKLLEAMTPAQKKHVAIFSEDWRLPKARSVAKLAEDLWQKSATKKFPWQKVAPQYLRECIALERKNYRKKSNTKKFNPIDAGEPGLRGR